MKNLHGLFLWVVLIFCAAGAPGGTLVQFRTSVGEIDVELYDAEKPVTVQNFLRYINAGAFTNSFFHRCYINGISVLQGGGCSEASPANTALFLSYAAVPTFAPITNEFLVGPRRSNTYGTIAMAKTSDPNSATSQFFFNLIDNSAALDNTNNSGGFTVFGHVISGTNVLNHFAGLHKPSGGIVDLTAFYGSAASLFSDLPVNYSANVPPAYSNLFYVNISTVNAKITPLANQSRQISWPSVNGLTNRVEYSTALSANWQTLMTTNGNGSTMSVTDSAPANPARFYRVRVSY